MFVYNIFFALKKDDESCLHLTSPPFFLPSVLASEEGETTAK